MQLTAGADHLHPQTRRLAQLPGRSASHYAVPEHARQRQVEIVADAAAMGMQKATEPTVRSLTDSTIDASRIEGKHLDPNAVEVSVRRRITAASAQAKPASMWRCQHRRRNGGHDHRYIARLTAERLRRWHRQLFPSPNPPNFAVSRWRDDPLGPMQVVSGGSIGRTLAIHFEPRAAERLDAETDAFFEFFDRGTGTRPAQPATT